MTLSKKDIVEALIRSLEWYKEGYLETITYTICVQRDY